VFGEAMFAVSANVWELGCDMDSSGGRIILAHFSHFLVLDVSCFFSLAQKRLVIKITYCFRGFHTFLFASHPLMPPHPSRCGSNGAHVDPGLQMNIRP